MQTFFRITSRSRGSVSTLSFVIFRACFTVFEKKKYYFTKKKIKYRRTYVRICTRYLIYRARARERMCKHAIETYFAMYYKNTYKLFLSRRIWRESTPRLYIRDNEICRNIIIFSRKILLAKKEQKIY